MTARALVLVALVLAGAACVRISVVGVHCKKTQLGINFWDFYTQIECKPAEINSVIEGDQGLGKELEGLYPDPIAPSEAAPQAPAPSTHKPR